MVEKGRIARRDGRSVLTPAPLFVLVEPQMGENIGAAARAMLNFGLSGLRLVSPRDGWPNERAGAMAAGASMVIDQTRVFGTTNEALADCNYVLATTARPREVLIPVLEPAEAAATLKARIDRGENCAVLFGGERSGLSNEDVMRADAIISIPVNPAFASLNLGQAALIVAYEWARADGRKSLAAELYEAEPASKENFERLFGHLIAELDDAGYFLVPKKRPTVERNIKAALTRAGMTEAEVRTFRGVIKALVNPRKRNDT
ncbi:MAG: tRNA (cytidine/uridine-2'-O-)-methyltransferase TrmJ [Hyphococcus sp.]|nr:MAG: tRNA (cytidine/uridine-2'-O-)-methyltransferase TrmJ [Marinicaulis sp.]